MPLKRTPRYFFSPQAAQPLHLLSAAALAATAPHLAAPRPSSPGEMALGDTVLGDTVLGGTACRRHNPCTPGRTRALPQPGRCGHRQAACARSLARSESLEPEQQKIHPRD